MIRLFCIFSALLSFLTFSPTICLANEAANTATASPSGTESQGGAISDAVFNADFNANYNAGFDADVVRKKIDAAATAMRTMHCHITQTKRMAMLNEQMISRGQMAYAAPDKLRWEYTEPYAFAFVLNGGRVRVQNGTKNNVQNRVFKEIARLMLNNIIGRSLSDVKDFNVALTEETTAHGTFYAATLTPLRKDVARLFRDIVLRFDRQTCLVAQVELREKNGDTTLIEMLHMTTNTPLAPETFSVE